MRALTICLQEFRDMASLRVNQLKFNLYMTGMNKWTRQELLSITGFQEGIMPFQYFGNPLSSERLRISDHNPLLDSLVKRINSQPQKTLPYVGKTQLIISVLQTMECFWLYILPILHGVIDHIYSICQAFIWTSKHPPISWAEMCKSKDGGLVIRDLKAWNLALRRTLDQVDSSQLPEHIRPLDLAG